MEKPKISVRRPPTADEFVAVSSGSQPPVAAKRGVVVHRRHGTEKRQVTAYLTPEQADFVDRRCRETGLRVSDVMAEAVQRWMKRLNKSESP